MAAFRLVIPAAVVEEVLAHARAEFPRECCGLLAGTLGREVGAVTHHFPVRNDAASGTEYRTNARDMLAAAKAMRAAGVRELAVYHSHPSAAAVPSRRDIDGNTYGEAVVHVIVGRGDEVRGWWLTAGGFHAADITTT